YNAYLEHKSDSYDDEFRILMENGEYKWVRTLAAAIWDDKGMPVKLTGSIEDITAQKEFENRIRKLAYYDVLTGLPNRVMFIEKFNEISASDECNIALIFMDVDNFKLINDSYGHNVGDDILVETGKRVLEVEIENMMLFRLGGDEFAILLWGDVGKEKVEDFVCEVVSRISKSYYIQEYIFNITISMGLAMYPADARNLRDLMKNSDMAMYKAKEAGKNRHVFFDNIMKEEALKRMLISNQLHGALGNNEFKLFYQPQYSTDGVAEGFEALIRWNNPELGNVSPAEFICIAEENRSIIPLGEWVLENSCRFLKEINVNDDANYFVSINISVLQIIRSDFSDYVLGLIKEYGLKPELLELEITESVFIESFDNIVKNITLLRQAGIRIALDDFGKGYSSLNYLTMLPITTLKIDKSFIDNIRQRDEKDVLVDSIIMIGRSLGLEVVAEGVETVEQLEYLRKYGCDRIQGYYFSKPLPEEEVWSVIEKKTDSR
ncbi:MAG: EAL domain-containing protein, partial [Clostridiales bacterium]|nr:EAL domain-containing protein [Clostridiales bacterium]